MAKWGFEIKYYASEYVEVEADTYMEAKEKAEEIASYDPDDMTMYESEGYEL